jgi:hypothetical protein
MTATVMSFGPEIDGFLDKLRGAGRMWAPDDMKRIRNDQGCCAIEALAQTGDASILSAIKVVGLSRSAALEIINAADDCDPDPALRAALLEACGLTEESA